MRILGAVVLAAAVVAVIGWLRVRRRPGFQLGMQIGLALLALYRRSRRARKMSRR